jgi:hypothetical protein
MLKLFHLEIENQKRCLSFIAPLLRLLFNNNERVEQKETVKLKFASLVIAWSIRDREVRKEFISFIRLNISPRYLTKYRLARYVISDGYDKPGELLTTGANGLWT